MMMKQADREWLTSWGYRRYALAPYEKWSKLEHGCELRIRTCDEREQKAYQAIYSAKLKAPGRRTGTYFSDDVAKLNRLMEKEVQELKHHAFT